MGQQRRTEIEDKLRELRDELGMRRPDLYVQLGVLCDLWDIRGADPVFEMVEWHLEWLIARLKLIRRTSDAEMGGTLERYRQTVRVTFNISIPEIADFDLTRRRNWFASHGGRSVSTTQRDMDRLIPQFVAILQRGKEALPPRDFVLAELERRKQGESAERFPGETSKTPTDPAPQPYPRPRKPEPNQRLDRTAANLAAEVERQLRAERRLRGVHDPYPIPIHWTAAPADLADHWENIRGTAGQAEPLPLDVGSLADAYRAVPSGRLVILGGAGTGKTTLAAELALALLAESPDTARVPVLLRLSSWSPDRQPFREWLTTRLLADYAQAFQHGQAATCAAELVRSGRILPVLDGFDELAHEDRAPAFRALKIALDNTDPLILTSREPEYAAAVKAHAPLSRAAVVQLEDLRLDDVAEYLRLATHGEEWAAVVDRLRTDTDAPEVERLRAVFATPLMVSLARTTYGHGQAQPGELLDGEKFRDMASIENHLLDGFVTAAYDHPPQDDNRSKRKHFVCSAEDARVWLGCIATHLYRQRTYTLWFWAFVNPLTKVLDALSYGFLGRPNPKTGTARLQRLFGPNRRTTSVRNILSSAGKGAATFGAATALSLWIYLRLSYGYGGLPAVGLAFASGAIVTFLSFVGSSILDLVVHARPPLHADAAPVRFSRPLAAAAALLVSIWIVGLVLLGLWIGENGVTWADADLVVGAAIGPLFATFLVACTAWTAWDGGRYSRLWLIVRRQLPLRTLAFLEDAHERGVVRRMGNVYQFRHAVLQIHLAERWLENQSPQTRNSGGMLEARYQLATALAAWGRSRAAESEFRSVLEREQQTLGSQHANTLWTRFQLSLALLDTQGEEAAVIELRETIATARAVVGVPRRFPDLTLRKLSFLVPAWDWLGWILVGAGRLEEAETTYSELLEFAGGIYSDDHWIMERARHNLNAVRQRLNGTPPDETPLLAIESPPLHEQTSG
ncbi:tetratricopeptide repeat protein [Phytohabitans suffuscus]|uniref:tetratricopeptide repeat protein n=1 Tax=Phytohabitans suffuscus TaxID=624315 RepID=UPI00156789A6|nr:tetratricopeptide repeat protein [Phytohabitans suffuscus]